MRATQLIDMGIPNARIKYFNYVRAKFFKKYWKLTSSRVPGLYRFPNIGDKVHGTF